MPKKTLLCFIIILFTHLLLAEDTTPAWYNKILNHFISKPPSDTTENPTQTRYEYFKQYENKTIRDIYIKNVDVFEVKEDSTFNIVNPVRKLGNKIHFNTDEYFIYMKLLFKQGDKIYPQDFVDSERLLRESKYIYSANIVIEPDETDPEQVDIYIYTRDIWSINVSGSYSLKKERGNLYLSDANFFGSSAEFFLNIKKHEEFKKGYNFDIGYKFGMFYDYLSEANFYYYGNIKNTRYGFDADKNFESPYNKHLYGVNNEWVQKYTTPIINDTLSTPFKIDYYEQGAWYAYAYSFSEDFEKPALRNHLILGGRVVNTEYYNPAELQGNFAKDNTLLLGNITFLRRQFYQDSHLFAFGKIEDVPIGLKIDFTAGINEIEDKYGNYIGVSFSYAQHNKDFGYHLLNIKSGGFRHEQRWENGIIEVSSLGISKLRDFHDFKWRHFHAVKYSESINPYTADNLLSLTNYYTQLGDDPSEYYGVKRLVLDLDTNVFLPYKFLNFTTSIIAFIDLGYIANKDEHLFNNTLQSGFGLTIRAKNEHLVFATMQLVFAYYPKGSTQGISDFRFFQKLDSLYQYDYMYYIKPSVYTF